MKKQAILCVDDDAIVLDSLKRQLQQNYKDRFVIETAESASEALELVEFLSTKKVDTLVVISDWLMPEMRGDEFLVKLHGKFPKVAKIMLSGQADEKAIANAVKNAQLRKFIAKPWVEKDLISHIDQAIKSA